METQFVKLSRSVVNLAHVAEVYDSDLEGKPHLVVAFVGGGRTSLYDDDADTLRWALDMNIAYSIDDDAMDRRRRRRRFELQSGAQADAAVEVANV